jgi:hypothetical protein
MSSWVPPTHGIAMPYTHMQLARARAHRSHSRRRAVLAEWKTHKTATVCWEPEYVPVEFSLVCPELLPPLVSQRPQHFTLKPSAAEAEVAKVSPLVKRRRVASSENLVRWRACAAPQCLSTHMYLALALSTSSIRLTISRSAPPSLSSTLTAASLRMLSVAGICGVRVAVRDTSKC